LLQRCTQKSHGSFAQPRGSNGVDFVDQLRSACEVSKSDPQALKLLLASFLPEYTPAHTHVGSTRMAAVAKRQEDCRYAA